MTVYRRRSTPDRRSHRRPMGMPDPMMVIGFGVVLLLTVLVFVFISNRSAQPTRVQAARSTPLDAETSVPVETRTFKVTRITSTPDPEKTAAPTLPTTGPTATKDISRTAANWQNWPVVPEFTQGAKEIYQRGQEAGRNPRAFSKIGSCESSATWFLEDFDRGAEWYTLGDYAKLSKTIEYFAGSFGRSSLAAHDGARVSTVFTALWADRTICEVNETPLDCEIHVHNPAFAIISLGSNDIDDPEKFENEMRKLIQLTIEQNVVPILSTKADDLEGGGANNRALAKLALEFDIPLWNFWAAVQDIPNGGLDWDGAHLTWSDNYFDQPGSLESGWAVRNLTALQVLDSMRAGVASISE
ncbi:MAG TPA: SGNH/GDSL hydrolase family protein [Anaerolineaceae bacterium]